MSMQPKDRRWRGMLGGAQCCLVAPLLGRKTGTDNRAWTVFLFTNCSKHCNSVEFTHGTAVCCTRCSKHCYSSEFTRGCLLHEMFVNNSPSFSRKGCIFFGFKFLVLCSILQQCRSKFTQSTDVCCTRCLSKTAPAAPASPTIWSPHLSFTSHQHSSP